MAVLNNKDKAFKRGVNLYSGVRLMAKALRSRFFKILARFMMVLAFTLVLIPLSGIKFFVNEESDKPVSVIKPELVVSDPTNLEFLPLLLNDLNNEDILKMGNKGLFLLSDEYHQYEVSIDQGDMEFSSVNDLVKQNSIPDESFDFIFTKSFESAPEFIDRSLKVGGVLAVQQLSEGSIKKPFNYKIVYLRRFDQSNVFVMKKLENAPTKTSITNTQRRLLGYNGSEAKRAALKKLEDVLLEPPRASSRTSKSYLKRTKYLPDLLGDSLESYPRRVFIDVGLPEREGGGGTSWFNKNYPTRNLKFEMYKIKTLTKESSKKEWVAPPNAAEIGMSDWLNKNVNEEEYVVMKAEAGVVEDMVKSKAIRLVDELFLECKPKGLGGRKNMSKRAYWECLALYGKLRDEGVAVHQWWGS